MIGIDEREYFFPNNLNLFVAGRPELRQGIRSPGKTRPARHSTGQSSRWLDNHGPRKDVTNKFMMNR